MKADKRLIAIAVVALVAFVAVGAFAYKAIKGPVEPAFLTAEATVGDIEHAVLATGTLQPAEVVNVGAQTSGQIISMPVKLGDIVQQGELIAVVESFQLQNRVQQAENQIRQAEAQLRSTSANLDLQETNLERETMLMEKGVGTQMKLDQARNQVANARANLTERENNVLNQQLALEDALNNLDRANVRAPMTGVIAEVVAREGQTINTNQQVPTIVKMAKMDVMTVRTQVSEADIIKVQPGQQVYFTILGDPERKYYATLRTRELTPAGGVLDPSGGGVQRGAIYYNVLFEVENTDGILFPGMTAEVHVVLDEARGVLTVPSASLGARGEDGRYAVRVLHDGVIQERRIQVGLNNNTRAEVLDGLEPGDQVIVGEAGGPSASEPPAPIFGGAIAKR